MSCIVLIVQWQDAVKREKALVAYADSLTVELKVQRILAQAGRDFLEGRIEEALAAYSLADSLLEGGTGFKNLLLDEVDARSTSESNMERIMASLRTERKHLKAKTDTIGALREEMTTLQSGMDSVILVSKLLRADLAKEALSVTDLRNEVARIRSSFGALEFQFAEGKAVTYVGDIVNGMANGEGIGIFSKNAFYHGQWKDNLRHGKGLYRWKNGDLYEGDYVEGKRHGQGVYTFTSGDKYIGEWKDDLRHGKGQFISEASGVTYEGVWKHDKYQRNGGSNGAEE